MVEMIGEIGEKDMKGFIFSFLLTISAIFYLSMPAVMASPLDSIGRNIMYLALPASVNDRGNGLGRTDQMGGYS